MKCRTRRGGEVSAGAWNRGAVSGATLADGKRDRIYVRRYPAGRVFEDSVRAARFRGVRKWSWDQSGFVFERGQPDFATAAQVPDRAGRSTVPVGWSWRCGNRFRRN